MNKQAIANTAICYVSEEEGEYVVESPLFQSVAAIGATRDEAFKVFHNLLDDAYEAYLEGRVPGYAKPGRPAKGGVAFNTDIKPASRKMITALAAKLGCSQGEVIDYLAFFHAVKSAEVLPNTPTAPNIEASIKTLVQQVIKETMDKKTTKPKRRSA